MIMLMIWYRMFGDEVGILVILLLLLLEGAEAH